MKGLLSVLCAALLAIGPAAEASITTTGAGKPVAAGGGGGGYTGPGDVVSGAAVFYGLRAYNATWADGAHKAVNIKRASDGQTCDVLLTTSGGLGNVTACSGSGSGAASAFCASDTCTVVTWYDQAGATPHNATQATQANQPTLNFSCLNGGTLPCLQFSGAQWLLNSAATNVQPVTASAVAERTGTFTTGVIMGLNSSQLSFGGANTLGVFIGARLQRHRDR